jgi:hypothetical protein
VRAERAKLLESQTAFEEYQAGLNRLQGEIEAL